MMTNLKLDRQVDEMKREEFWERQIAERFVRPIKSILSVDVRSGGNLTQIKICLFYIRIQNPKLLSHDLCFIV